jgi:hypothetical protein
MAEPEEAAAEAARRELGAVLRQSAMPALMLRELLEALDLKDERVLLDADICERMGEAGALADSEAGDRKKYMAVGESTLRRWDIFLAVKTISDTEQPTFRMVKEFADFMYTTRQRASSAGKEGLGDSIAHVAEHVLPQVRWEG